MPKLLPPTVGERLAQCGTRVEVWGIWPGAEVTLTVNGGPQVVVVPGTAFTFSTGPLAAKAKVRAKQRLGPDTSEWSNEVIAEPVSLPPSPPHMEPSSPRCVQSLFASGVTPGSKVEVIQGLNVVAATGVAGREGSVCMPVTQPPPTGYTTQTTTCGTVSPNKGHVKIDPPLSEIPAATIVEPVFECQSVVPFTGLTPGAVYEIFVTDRDGVESSLGTFGACTPNMTVTVPRNFKPKDRLMAAGAMVNARWECRVPGEESNRVEVVPPDDRIKPVIGDPVWEGDRTIEVTNQIEGGSITLMRKERADSATEENLGSRPSRKEAEVPVGAQLEPGNVIWIVQELCGVSKASDQVTVKGRPADVPAVAVRKTVCECAEIVLVDQVIPGATVLVKHVPVGMPGSEFPIGQVKSPTTTAIVPCFPTPRSGFEVVAYQQVSGTLSPPSGRVPVEICEDVPKPVIMPPVRPGDAQVWCANLLVGARVRLFRVEVGISTVRVQIGGGTAVDSTSAIPVWGTIPPGTIWRVVATQVMCRESAVSDEVLARSGQPCDGPPHYNPGPWNDQFNVEENNCYNYATDKMQNNFAQPGGHVESINDICTGCRCDNVSAKALSDGLHRCTSGVCPPCHHKVALVMAPNRDFHWYRQDDDGTWSHKPGDGPARNVDDSDNPILNPETADRGPYTDFCGYFCVYKPDVHLTGVI
jgi:hypothetical protein